METIVSPEESQKVLESTKREKIFAKSGGLCWYCGEKAEQIDHIYPVFLGGKGNTENLVPVCKWCNKSKRGLELEIWRDKLSLKAGLVFTKAQRNFWPNLPEDRKYIFWFEAKGLSDDKNS